MYRRRYQEGGHIGQTAFQDYLESIGLGMGQMGTMTSQGLAQYYGQRYGIGEQELLKPELFPTISQDVLSGMKAQTYDPLLQASQPTMLRSLLQGARKVKPTGFASFGRYKQNIGSLRDEYGRNVGGILENIQKNIGTATTSAYQTAKGWGEMASSLAG